MRLIDADELNEYIGRESLDTREKIFALVDRMPTLPKPCEKPCAFEQPHREWIPCSERLPEDIKPVIVTWKNNDPKSYYQYIVGKHFIGTAHYLNGKWFWYSSTTEDLLAEYGRCDGEEFDEAIEVIAWMPLPEPYKGGETE